MSERKSYPLASALGAERGVPASPSFPDLEAAVLAHWKSDDTFEASVGAREAGEKGSNEYVFYDGPPFANGLPHYGHLLTGYVKDVVPRYQTMLGKRVERRFGWDCHGLPAEVEAERQLGITHKSQIEELGVAAFNDACRTSVLKYTDEWRDYVTRQARWVDFDHDYKTLDTDYMESVMWAFKTLWDKGLVYEGFRVLAYCWRCETPLSNTETRMDDVYRQRQDPAVTVGMTLTSGDWAGAKALIWTTTPWTLPSNLAMAVGPDVEYALVEPSEGAFAGQRLVLAAARVGAYARELGGGDAAPTVLATKLGRELLGTTYTPPFAYFTGRENAHQVLLADYVTTDDGTGVVHIAPAFGEDDKLVTDAAGIEAVVPVDGQGTFDARVSDYEGQHVFDANAVIIKDLKAATRGDATEPTPVTEGTVLVRQETYDHPYPHCWRCGNALIYRAVSSWFVKVTAIRDRMVELNQQIDWVPGHVKDGSFGKWLEGARDWSISRNRFWGSPIPVWTSDDPTYPRVDVYGSLAELERDFGVKVTDLHRPFVDELTRPNPDDPTGKSTMRRVPEVLDCWFESGSMPFAQVHYPFENAEWFEHHYPGDFIVEYVGQTRGWFYTLHVLATALFDRPAFRTALVHGIVLGDDGRKMSKSLRNYPDVSEVFARDGADAMRWFLMSSPILRGGNLVTTEAGIRDGVRQVLLPLWSTWYFLALYAGALRPQGDQDDDGEGVAPSAGLVGRWRTDSPHELDRYVLASLRDLVSDVRGQLDALDVAGACESVRVFLDLLTNWYVRRSRERFWGNGPDAVDAVDTLHTVLEVLTRVVAPLLPLTAEEIWRGLTGGRSVHLADYPSPEDLPADPDLVEAMDAVRAACSAALGLRKAGGLRVRQPLPRLTIAVPGGGSEGALRELVGLVADEVNVKDVVLLDAEDSAAENFGVTQKLTVNARAAGPRIGKQVQQAIQASRSGSFEVRTAPDGSEFVVAGGIELLPGEYELSTVVGNADAGAERVTATLPGGGFVALETTVDEGLAAEGWANDVVRLVQDARKTAGLHVSDRIALVLDVPDEREAWARAHADRIGAEVLATSVEVRPGADDVLVEVTKAPSAEGSTVGTAR
ncbi:Isoleucyl-tRNA synthetase [Quadrisphaera granulorum]|uniref:Isoleucine--tRNA ligase n=1 Tax=Quadrisphaera granulorum TaxID=317664 RepID=A0A316AV31_9ACTN|nr:isoleucine--tRNA ligase [Quadrisphaera granulorum]PWJ53957.1 isoleucyl-tRNA synthetase [Quadrisphaera granulorum]SZE96414.1 Isoleucyl-tRNA synthetase [Quadrisphaera granulorum]